MFLNFINNSIVKVQATKDPNCQRSVEITETQRLRLGSISGFEKDFPLSVNYVLDTETNKFIIVSTSNYGSKYKPLIGRMFDTLDIMKASCLRLYLPPNLD
jgi:hypothetical protein